MKKAIWGLMALMIIAGLVGCTTMGPGKGVAKEGLVAKSEPAPMVVVGTPVVKMSKKVEIVIMGTGFEPGQEVRLLFTTMDGVTADIGYALKPQPVANKLGAWITTWKCDRYIKKKLIKEGAYTIKVTDSEYNFLAHAPVAFYVEKEKKSEKEPKKK